MDQDVQHLLAQLQQLEHSINESIASYRSATHKQQDVLSQLQATMRHQLSTHRALVRDLELLAEEQDTYAGSTGILIALQLRLQGRACPARGRFPAPPQANLRVGTASTARGRGGASLPTLPKISHVTPLRLCMYKPPTRLQTSVGSCSALQRVASAVPPSAAKPTRSRWLSRRRRACGVRTKY